MHGRSEKKYKSRYYSFSIPVIILSTLTGAANVGMDSFVSAENKPLASAIVGGVNIVAGIISTLQNFLKVAELMEAHRIAGVSWGKLGRNISIELSLDQSRRVIQSDFLKISRAEYDRLIEAGPIIDDDIIYQFNKKFKNYEVSVPSICNGLDKCNIYRINKLNNTKENYDEGIEDFISNNKQEFMNDFSNNKNINIKIEDNNKDNVNNNGDNKGNVNNNGDNKDNINNNGDNKDNINNNGDNKANVNNNGDNKGNMNNNGDNKGNMNNKGNNQASQTNNEDTNNEDTNNEDTNNDEDNENISSEVKPFLDGIQ